MIRAFFIFALAGAVVAGGCANPVHDDAVAALGPEDPNVPPGPLHRPGQPCLVCHASDGPASLQFATAGTVYQDGMNVFPNAIPMAGATVTFTDACASAFPNPSPNDPSTPQFATDCPNADPTTLIRGVVSQVETNCAGNFYVLHDDWVAAGVTYPMRMSMAWQSNSTAMISHMSKETSCAQCHIYENPAMNGMPATAGASGADGVGQIYLNFLPLTPPPPGCQ